MRKLIGCVVLCACASQGMPPGGPPDVAAPKLLSVTPDSGKTGVKGEAAVFQFDEVVSERPSNATTLGDIFVVSPRQGAPNVAWHRQSISVKPRKGWLPNTTYTVTLLPGLGDLRGNVRNTGATTFFSTGSAIDAGTISGFVGDLLFGGAAAGAVVEARLPSDTTVAWMTRTDSGGVFHLEHLPRKTFSVRTYVDKNKNFAVDPGEPLDTGTVAAGDSATSDFLIFVRDSVAPRLATAVTTDSVTIAVTFDAPADSASALTLSNYSVVASDSTTVPVVAVKLPPPDSALKRLHTAHSVPVARVVLTLGRALAEKTQYRLRVTGVRGILGQTMPSEALIRKESAAPPNAKPGLLPNLPGGAVPLPIKHD